MMNNEYEHYLALKESEYAAALSEWYSQHTGQPLDLRNPKTFNEKIQWLKLYDSSPLKTLTTDKYLVRDWVKGKIGEQYLIPLLGVYNSFSEINFDDLPTSFVIKTNHGAGWNCVVKNKNVANLGELRKRFDKWMSSNYAFQFGFELHYKDIQPKVVVEKYIENKAGNLYDYKIWCFGGEPRYIQFLTDRATKLKMCFFDAEWNRQEFSYDYELYTGNVEKPQNLGNMLRIARVLSQNFYHVCIDLYHLNDGTIYFGEITHTRMSGVCAWHPAEWDLRMGELLNLPKNKDKIMKRFNYILPESTEEIRRKYYRYAMLSVMTFGETRRHYIQKKAEYRGRLSQN